MSANQRVFRLKSEVAAGWDFSGIPNPGILGFLSQKNPKSENPKIPGFPIWALSHVVSIF